MLINFPNTRNYESQPQALPFSHLIKYISGRTGALVIKVVQMISFFLTCHPDHLY